MTKNKMISMAVKVSVPRGGEFLVTVKVDPNDVSAADGGKNFGGASSKDIKQAILDAVSTQVMEKIKIAPLAGQLVKANDAFHDWLDSGR